MPFEIVKTKQHVCTHSYSCVTQTTINVCIVCVSACICLWTGQMGKRHKQSPKKGLQQRKRKEEGKQGERALGAEMLQCLCGLPSRITEHPLTDECRRAQ